MNNASAGSLSYASAWKRLLAFFIDLPILLLLMAAFRAMFTQLEGIEYAVFLFYYTALEGSGLQATVGKKVLGLKVARLDGSRVGFLRAAGRTLGKFVSIISLGAGFALMFFTGTKQTFHDYIAGCVILDNRISPQDGSSRISEEPA